MNFVKKNMHILIVPIVMILLACLIIPAYAMPGKEAGIGGGKIGGGNMTARLDHLEEQGYDVRAIRAAVESGDGETARSLMQQFMEEHKDEFPSPVQKEDRIVARLDHLEEQGYDVRAIRAAVESGDGETARLLMQQFMEEHKDEFPSPVQKEDRIVARLDHLEEQGYDVRRSVKPLKAVTGKPPARWCSSSWKSTQTSFHHPTTGKKHSCESRRTVAPGHGEGGGPAPPFPGMTFSGSYQKGTSLFK